MCDFTFSTHQESTQLAVKVKPERRISGFQVGCPNLKKSTSDTIMLPSLVSSGGGQGGRSPGEMGVGSVREVGVKGVGKWDSQGGGK